MTSESDKLLAQGPRTAPEPVTADGLSAPASSESTMFETSAAEPDVTATNPPIVKARPQGSWLTGSLLRRLIPLVLVLGVLGRSFAGGHAGGWAFALIWIAAAVVLMVSRGRRRRPW